MAVKMSYSENIKLALQSIVSNKLRTFLTALIIAIGITALIGVLTSIDAIKSSLTDSFSSMGSNSFNIRNRGLNVRIGNSGEQSKVYSSITYREAASFKEAFKFDAVTSLSVNVSWAATAKYKSEKTNPNIGVIGSDESYLKTSGYSVALGRNFTNQEVYNGSSVVIIGDEIYQKLFKGTINPIGEFMTIGGVRYQVIGVLKSKGSSAGMGADKACLVPLLKARTVMDGKNPSYIITVSANDPIRLEAAVGEATIAFRNIRGLTAKQASDFEITKSDAVAQILLQNMVIVTMGAIVIALITLIGASIGLMNIMLVSVTERTREIGIRKAIGATPSVIRKQFLIEAVVICLIGGAAGILLGIVIGNVLALQLGASFIVPWNWIILGFTVCVLVGMLSGYYPASKASKLDPVEALRYE
ncbi:ABC transporter permease [Sphingobacterium faecium NBRC 15299]|jgi:putative ABC transport system permease protein|uniref:ABC transporter permease n=1 Tax=Sphingobacterium faecium TaxID=34087 RepID=UPI000D370821|nr:ABC transporter permease [Sphingobacterium faecium]PTX11059.1 putative ABC transport system permease protein [Sphingobacterium faecium]GEM62928.1 ABC transporter permease [Sphingobacterium faecium NBRC 15299]